MESVFLPGEIPLRHIRTILSSEGVAKLANAYAGFDSTEQFLVAIDEENRGDNLYLALERAASVIEPVTFDTNSRDPNLRKSTVFKSGGLLGLYLIRSNLLTTFARKSVARKSPIVVGINNKSDVTPSDQQELAGLVNSVAHDGYAETVILYGDLVSALGEDICDTHEAKYGKNITEFMQGFFFTMGLLVRARDEFVNEAVASLPTGEDWDREVAKLMGTDDQGSQT